ncbi:MAG: FliI/YscN family ATPase [candidate division Zixibacteria bacterium]|nr:FliI/YscN family ATPase [candidate division Zixibacteria bacterium]
MYAERIDRLNPIKHYGKVTKVIGLVVESAGPAVSIGRLCTIESKENDTRIKAEVVGFRDDRIVLMPLGPITGITPGSIVTSNYEELRVPVGKELIGRVLGGLGQPIDDLGPIESSTSVAVNNKPIPALRRRKITNRLLTGIKSIDLTMSVAQGQRLGIFAGSGIGKSIMLGMMARGTSADINVIALIGERGREVREFIENDLGPEGMKNSIVVAVTSDEPPLIRIKGAMVATAIAEYFRDRGKNVLLLFDSLTRVSMAQREIGIAAGEPPTTKGYTPSVFAMLPALLERAGLSEKGSITGFYAVLVEGDDFNEPIADAVRSILDGHVTLSRKMASLNQYPAIDILDSVSRLMKNVSTDEEMEIAAQTRKVMAIYREAEDLINIGAYVKGSNPEIDDAIIKNRKLLDFFRQGINEIDDYEASYQYLKEIFKPAETGTNEKV